MPIQLLLIDAKVPADLGPPPGRVDELGVLAEVEDEEPDALVGHVWHLRLDLGENMLARTTVNKAMKNECDYFDFEDEDSDNKYQGDVGNANVHDPILDTRMSLVLQTSSSSSRSGYPPCILKPAGLESSGRIA